MESPDVKRILTPRGYGLGHRPGPYPPGTRSTKQLFGAARPGGPGSADLSGYVDQIRDQAQTQRCVGAGRARVLHIQAQVQKFSAPNPSGVPYPSEQGIYSLGREEEAADGQQPLTDTGSIPALADQALCRDIGVPLERDFNPADSDIDQRVPVDVLARALAIKMTGYFVIDSDPTHRVDDVCQALTNRHALTICIQVGDEYESCHSEQPVVAAQGRTYGGHCIALVGWRVVNGRRQFLNPGSWGYGWGFGGWAWLDESVISDPRTTDLVVPTAVVDWTLTSAGQKIITR